MVFDRRILVFSSCYGFPGFHFFQKVVCQGKVPECFLLVLLLGWVKLTVSAQFFFPAGIGGSSISSIITQTNASMASVERLRTRMFLET